MSVSRFHEIASRQATSSSLGARPIPINWCANEFAVARVNVSRREIFKDMLWNAWSPEVTYGLKEITHQIRMTLVATDQFLPHLLMPKLSTRFGQSRKQALSSQKYLIIPDNAVRWKTSSSPA
mmetsp:Transcript_18151/g.37798  ORF Transcript_18151/g.37798 Transcript_18151/m.37798 type:complete len:123 (+) Transcript_18151:977-1345(+)